MTIQEIQKLEKKIKENRNKYLDLLEHEMLNDDVLIYPVVFDQQNGIYTPESYDDKSSYGIVVAKGKGRLLDDGTRVSSGIEVGDFVRYGRYSTTKERVGGFDFLTIKEEEIISKAHQ